MVSPEEVSAPMSTQVTEQVAPTPSDAPTPHPDSHSQSQSALHNTSEPETFPTQNDPSQSQEEKLAEQMTPASPLMCTTSPVTPPLEAQVVTPGSSREDITVPPTPSTTAPSSDQQLSRLEIFDSRSKGAYQKHYERANVFHKTRSSIRCLKDRMQVFASRGFERGYLPTRRTKPRLLKRRYSIDVNTTKNWGVDTYARWLDCNWEIGHINRCHEMDSLLFSPFSHHLPDPRRYAAFGPGWFPGVVHNSKTFFELGDVIIQNDSFNYIGATDYQVYHEEVWMRDESLDMALEVLRRDENCDAHGIDIANSTVAQICNYARTDSGSGGYEQYKSRYQNKKWIFVVCNDAMGSLNNNGNNGTHWSLVAINRISKSAYYYDSLYIDMPDYHDLGTKISLGMLRILGETPGQWTYSVQHHSPNQHEHNLFRYDGGACGPFVFKMTQLLIKRIKAWQVQGVEHMCDLRIHDRFATEVFKPQFHSEDVRAEIMTSILRRYHMAQATRIADQYDQYAIHDTDAVLDDEPVVGFEIPQRPQLPALSTTHHTGRGFSVGTDYHNPINLDDSDGTHDNSSDSEATIINGEQDTGVDANMDDGDNLLDDDDGSVAAGEETESGEDGDEDAPATFRSIVNISSDADAEEEAEDIRLDEEP